MPYTHIYVKRDNNFGLQHSFVRLTSQGEIVWITTQNRPIITPDLIYTEGSISISLAAIISVIHPAEVQLMVL